jgi:hypothetical protein
MNWNLFDSSVYAIVILFIAISVRHALGSIGDYFEALKERTSLESEILEGELDRLEEAKQQTYLDSLMGDTKTTEAADASPVVPAGKDGSGQQSAGA